MKKTLPFLIMFSLLLLSSCSKDDDTPKEYTVTYYVNHWATVNFNATVKVTYTGDYGKEESFELSGSRTIIASHIPSGTTVKLTMEKPVDGGNIGRIEYYGNTVASFTDSKQKETITWTFE